ncbi:hypothetical protein POF51_06895 [Brevibacillus sp. AG]|uniref:hypothetical protein n=1 Tax=Brevibacillus sp. AG TaxID=3020891 RepID=UPI000AF4EFFF|nr:hypothetical protein [Brevibacillus sp. AG]MDC0760411.1 hypothetical protein [Brevibacillus sp. AG]
MVGATLAAAMMVTAPLMVAGTAAVTVAGTVEVTRASINRERRRGGAFFVFSQVLRNLSYNRGKGLMEVWICNS